MAFWTRWRWQWENLSQSKERVTTEHTEEKIEAFGGTISLEFKPGACIAGKIINDRGIENLRVIKMQKEV